MIVVKVTYTVKDAYADTNKALINRFLKAFRSLDQREFLYTVFQSDNGNTFTHISRYKNKEIQASLLSEPEFLYFQQERDKNLALEPEIEFLNYLGASKEVL